MTLFDGHQAVVQPNYSTLLTVILVWLLLFAFVALQTHRYSTRSRYLSIARSLLKRITQPHRSSAEKLHILATTHHFVFEELVLLSLKKHHNFKILRNTRYTHDNGIDGRYKKRGDRKWRLVQAKRYQTKAHVRVNDINRFYLQCRKNSVTGLFITTGKISSAIKMKYRGKIAIVDHENIVDFFSPR